MATNSRRLGTFSLKVRQSMRGQGIPALLDGMGTTHKKVIIRKVDRDTISGYVSASFIADGKI